MTFLIYHPQRNTESVAPRRPPHTHTGVRINRALSNQQLHFISSLSLHFISSLSSLSQTFTFAALEKTNNLLNVWIVRWLHGALMKVWTRLVVNMGNCSNRTERHVWLLHPRLVCFFLVNVTSDWSRLQTERILNIWPNVDQKHKWLSITSSIRGRVCVQSLEVEPRQDRRHLLILPLTNWWKLKVK